MGQLEPPYPLIRDGLRQGRVIPFFGSGASLGNRNPVEMPWTVQAAFLPTASELAAYLAKKTQFPDGETQDLPKVAQYYSVVGGRGSLNENLHGIFNRDYPNTSLHAFLGTLL